MVMRTASAAQAARMGEPEVLACLDPATKRLLKYVELAGAGGGADGLAKGGKGAASVKIDASFFSERDGVQVLMCVWGGGTGGGSTGGGSTGRCGMVWSGTHDVHASCLEQSKARKSPASPPPRLPLSRLRRTGMTANAFDHGTLHFAPFPLWPPLRPTTPSRTPR
eukprot:358312-Chlamydomonas_euryale.AAC.1